MSNKVKNIFQVTDFGVLKNIVGENLTVIIGFTCPETHDDVKIMIRQFLKRKAEKFPLIKFVFMDLNKEQIKNSNLNIVSKDYDTYPLIYHIRDGHNVLCTIENATQEAIYDAFDTLASKYYKKDMEEFLDRAKSLVENKGSKKVKPKVMMNVEVNNSNDTDAEIEIDKHNQEHEEGEHDDNHNDNHNDNADTVNNPANNEIVIDEKTKALIEAKKFQALERHYIEIQKKMEHEIKRRINIEEKNEEDNDKKSKKDKTDKKAKEKEERTADKQERDQIGPSKKKGTVRERPRR